MNFSSAIGLLAAIIGLTTTLHASWKYLSSSERSKKERLGAVAVVVVSTVVVIGVAAGIAYATAATPVGQQTIPVPFVPTANPAYPQTGPTASPASTPTPQLSPTSVPTSTPTSVPEPTVTPTPKHGK